MAKLTTNDITGGKADVDLLNANFAAVETAMENTLSRDGTTPNTMSANFDLNSNKVINSADPTNNTDLVTKSYGDTNYGGSAKTAAEAAQAAAEAAQTAAETAETNAETAETGAQAAQLAAEAAANGMKWRPSVKAGTTGNITLSGEQTIDGISVTAGERVLVKDQSTASENGVYICSASAWSRATDADVWDELVAQVVVVEEGSTLADLIYLCTVDDGGTLGVTAVTWSILPAVVADLAITTAKLADGAVTLVKMDDIDASAGIKVIGRSTASDGIPELLDVLDEDNMTSDSATSLATQQSIKAYVDNNVGSVPSITDNGTEEALNINADEIVTMPKQPAFESYASATLSNVTGDGTAYTIVYNTETVDRNADMTTTTFTAPVTGMYAFSANVRYTGHTASNTTANLQIVSSGGDTIEETWNPGVGISGNSSNEKALSGMLYLTASETVTTIFQMFDTGSVVDITQARFNGCLLS